MISLWQHIPTVLALLGMHIVMYLYYVQKLDELKFALKVKGDLLGEVTTDVGQHFIMADDTLSLRGRKSIVHIKSTAATTLTITVEGV